MSRIYPPGETTPIEVHDASDLDRYEASKRVKAQGDWMRERERERGEVREDEQI